MISSANAISKDSAILFDITHVRELLTTPNPCEVFKESKTANEASFSNLSGSTLRIRTVSKCPL